jgi:uncharacterized membrane protein YidH (DUF202 family)
MHILSLTIDVVLAGYVIWEVVQFVPSYRLLKEAVARGDVDARKRIYQQAFAFEWISALLALAALGFDWNRLNPKFLALDSAGLMQSLPQGKDFDRGGIAGLLIGLAAGTLGLMVARIRANRRGATRSVDAPAPWWRKLLPDFSALIPVTTQERFFWALWPSARASARKLCFADGCCRSCTVKSAWTVPHWSWWLRHCLGWRTRINASRG